MTNKEKITYSGKKYLPLKEYLQSLDKSRVMLSHKEMEKILGDELPESAYKHKAFWGNNRAKKDADHSNSWLEAGWEVEKIDRKNKVIHFKKKKEKLNTQMQYKAFNLNREKYHIERYKSGKIKVYKLINGEYEHIDREQKPTIIKKLAEIIKNDVNNNFPYKIKKYVCDYQKDLDKSDSPNTRNLGKILIDYLNENEKKLEVQYETNRLRNHQ